MSSTPAPPPAKRRRWLRLLALLLVTALIGGIVYIFRDELRDEWALRRFRSAAANGSPALPERQEQLRERLLRKSEAENLDLAVRLAEDSDPKVRAASVELLLSGQPRAKKQNAEAGPTAFVRFSSWRTRVSEALQQLLRDPDETVCHTALRGISELESADVFSSQLTGAMKTGTTPERVIVAEHLAHWNGPLLYQVVGDESQPDVVRIAAMGSLTTYGDKQIAAWRSELRAALETALRSGNTEVRKAAIVALLGAQQAPAVWLDVMCDDAQKELHSLALRTWLLALSNDDPFGRHWSETHDVWFGSTGNAVRCGVTTHVLCEAAKNLTKLLDTSQMIAETDALVNRQGPTGRAFEKQITHLGNVLSVVSAAQWYCDSIEKPPELTVRLPFEEPKGAPPKREMRAFVFREAKPVWEWCLAHKEAYHTRFLSTRSIIRAYHIKDAPNPPQSRPLGAMMDDLMLSQTEFDKLRAKYDAK